MARGHINATFSFVRLIGLVVLVAVSVRAASTENVDTAVTGLADRIGKVLVAKGKPKLAVLDFTDIEGRPTEFGRYLAEQLSVEFVNAPGISVVDRANLKSILAEHKLSEEGLVNPDAAKKLGQFAGVDVLVIGTVTDIDDGYSVTVKGIATDTAQIVAASKATIAKTRETQQLGSRMVASASGTSTGVRDSAQAAPLATKDFGDLRITLKSVNRTRVNNGWDTVAAVECGFDLTNTNVTRAILCAANAEESHPNVVRAQLRSPSGDVLGAIQCRGLSAVCVYGYGASPGAIAQTIMAGQHIDGPRGYYPNERLWEGDMTAIAPGNTIHVAIVFVPPPERARQPFNVDSLHLELELVLGEGTRAAMGAGTGALPRSAQLCTLALDGLTVASR